MTIEKQMLEPKPNSSTTDAGLPSALLAQNPMLSAAFLRVIFVNFKLKINCQNDKRFNFKIR